MKLSKINRFGTDIHILEFNAEQEKLTLAVAAGDRAKRQKLTDIKHNYFESRGYKRVAGINLQFFNWVKAVDTVGMEYVDSGFLKGDTSLNDSFVELIYQSGKLSIDEVNGTTILKKYPNAQWAVSLGYTLMVNGKIDIRKNEKFDHAKYPNPRTMIGQKKDGTIIFAVTDGRSDRGLTATEQANVMNELKAVTAINCDGGGSSELIVEDKIINNISSEREIANALLVYARDIYNIERVEEKQIGRAHV